MKEMMDDGDRIENVACRNRRAMRSILSEEDTLRRSGYIPRCAIQHSLVSEFSTLYRSGDGSALITVTGFDHAGFQHLLSKFAPMYDIYMP